MYDVVIVGGGLVGASLASALRETGLKIAIIEAAPWFEHISPPSYDDRVIALAYASQRILEQIGCWAHIAPHATPIKHIHVTDRGHCGVTRLHHDELNLPALGYVVAARQLGQAMQATLKNSNVDIFAPAKIVEVTDNTENLTLSIQHKEQLNSIKTRLLVAADGGNSAIRQQLNIPIEESDYQQTAIIANVSTQKPHHNVAHERFTDSGPLALLPMQGQQSSLVWTVNHEDVEKHLALSESAFLAALQQRFGWRLGRFTKVGARHAYPLKLMRIQQHIAHRRVIIGNAAHTVHPIAGQGLNLGLRDVASLAEVIITAAQKKTDIGSQTVLNHYVSWQAPDQQRVTSVTDALVRIFSNTALPVAFARNLGLMATNHCLPLKKQLMKQMTGLHAHPAKLVRGAKL